MFGQYFMIFFIFFINLTLSIDLKNTVLIGLLIDILYIHTTFDEGSLLLLKISLKRLGDHWYRLPRIKKGSTSVESESAQFILEQHRSTMLRPCCQYI